MIAGPTTATASSTSPTRAADLLGFRTSGTAWVKVEYVGRAPLEGSDDRLLAATFRQDEPAPAPGTVKVAATRIAPVGSTASILRNTRYASVSASDAEPPARGRCLTPQGRVDATAPINSSTAVGFTKAC